MPVTLRPARAEERADLLALVRRPEVAPSLSVVASEGLQEALDRVAAGAEDEAVLVVEDDGRPVGLVRWQTRNHRFRIAGVHAVAIDPAHRGRGLATAALRALVAELVEVRGLHRLEAEAYGFNDAAIRAFEAAGFSREGIRRAAYQRHGAWQDGVLLGLVARE